VCLQNCCKLRFLTALEITIITQCSGKRLILMLKKLHQVYQPIKTDFFQQKPEPNAGDSKQNTLKDDCRLLSTIFIFYFIEDSLGIMSFHSYLFKSLFGETDYICKAEYNRIITICFYPRYIGH
jgi:hypothetical protein